MNRVVGILERHTSLRERSPFVVQMALMSVGSDYAMMMIDDYVSYLREILTGIKEER